MKPDTHDREKQLAALEHNQRQTQARYDLQATKDQDFYTRLGLSGPEAEEAPGNAFVISVYCDHWTHQDREAGRSEEHTSELQSLMRSSYAVFCLIKQPTTTHIPQISCTNHL